MAREQGRKLVAQNKKARHDYSIEDVYEAGLDTEYARHFFPVYNADFASPGIGTNQPGSNAFQGQTFYNPDAGTLGNLQRRAFTGPWDLGWDMSVIKRISLTERQKLDLHFDFFNTFNHPTYLMSPSSAGDSGTTGVYTINSTTFGQFTSTSRDARQIQIGARYSF